MTSEATLPPDAGKVAAGIKCFAHLPANMACNLTQSPYSTQLNKKPGCVLRENR